MIPAQGREDDSIFIIFLWCKYEEERLKEGKTEVCLCPFFFGLINLVDQFFGMVLEIFLATFSLGVIFFSWYYFLNKKSRKMTGIQGKIHSDNLSEKLMTFRLWNDRIVLETKDEAKEHDLRKVQFVLGFAERNSMG